MLVTELQNQDPTQPMSNTDLMNQVSQIQSIESNQQLTSTLQSVALGQSIASAGSLIGATVTGTGRNSKQVTGTVNSVSISNGSATLNVGSSTITLSNVTQIAPAGSSAPAARAGERCRECISSVHQSIENEMNSIHRAQQRTTKPQSLR